jgi:hypothetical protein
LTSIQKASIKKKRKDRMKKMTEATRIPRTIMAVREIIKDIRHDMREGKMPKIVFKRIIHCMSEVKDTRDKEKIDYPLQYILLLAFLAVLSGAEKCGS